MKTPVIMFNSYAHADEKLADELFRGIETRFKSDMLFSFQIWRDTGIFPGERWREEINDALKSCQAGLLFVSPDFLASKFITEIELKVLCSEPKKIILPVMLSPVDFQRMHLQGLEDLQIFRHRGNAFGQCTGTHQKIEFINAAYAALHDRLKKELIP